ncbi:unnamed protein product [Caenorhabditis nigoni]
MENDFLIVYCSFNSFQMENQHEIAFWADESTQLMREASESYFLGQHFKRRANDETDFVCRFDYCPVDLGESRKGTLAYVQLHGQKEETKYNNKSHHFGSPDIKETFCYKLLELINAEKRTALYIATRWENNFIPLSGNKDKAVNVDFLVQILLLRTFLFIDDVYSENCGYWKDTKEVGIVDFMSRAFFEFTNVKRALFNNNSSLSWETSHIDALEACDEATLMEVARKCLKKWDLLFEIDLAHERIAPVKDRMRHSERLTEELDQCVSIIKQNIIKLNEFLEPND